MNPDPENLPEILKKDRIFDKYATSPKAKTIGESERLQKQF